MASLSPEGLLQAARFVIHRTAPHFAPLLLLCLFVPDATIETAAMNARGVCRYNPAFIAKCANLKQVAGVVLHEVLHLFLKHCHNRGDRDPLTWNLAADMVVNGVVQDCGLELVPGAITAEGYKWPRGETVFSYYDRLSALPKPPPPPQGGGAQSKNKGTGQGQGPAPGPGVQQGNCGGCATHAEDPHAPPDPSQPAGASPAAIDRAVKASIEALRSAKVCGAGAATLKRIAEIADEAPQVPWRKRLRYVAANAVQKRPGAEHLDRRTINRRMVGLGVGPGRPIIAGRKDLVPRVLVAIDTSGSMGPDDLRRALRELGGILKALGAEVEVVPCDSIVHGARKVRRLEDAAEFLKGGGGTDFRPVFEYAERARPRPDLIVFATDGCGPAPEQPPPGIATIWLLTASVYRAPVKWGTTINVDD